MKLLKNYSFFCSCSLNGYSKSILRIEVLSYKTFIEFIVFWCGSSDIVYYGFFKTRSKDIEKINLMIVNDLLSNVDRELYNIVGLRILK